MPITLSEAIKPKEEEPEEDCTPGEFARGIWNRMMKKGGNNNG